jgi:hypothetical protein
MRPVAPSPCGQPLRRPLRGLELGREDSPETVAALPIWCCAAWLPRDDDSLRAPARRLRFPHVVAPTHDDAALGAALAARGVVITLPGEGIDAARGGSQGAVAAPGVAESEAGRAAAPSPAGSTGLLAGGWFLSASRQEKSMSDAPPDRWQLIRDVIVFQPAWPRCCATVLSPISFLAASPDLLLEHASTPCCSRPPHGDVDPPFRELDRVTPAEQAMETRVHPSMRCRAVERLIVEQYERGGVTASARGAIDAASTRRAAQRLTLVRSFMPTSIDCFSSSPPRIADYVASLRDWGGDSPPRRRRRTRDARGGDRLRRQTPHALHAEAFATAAVTVPVRFRVEALPMGDGSRVAACGSNATSSCSAT